MSSWKETLNLPATEFPMKANLTQREPEILRRWEEMDLYAKVREARRGAQPFVFHDGPPYANGEGHVGTFRNKILKDVSVRCRSMAGFDAPFVPGWDCHGLPIEHNVMKDLGSAAAKTPAPEVRRLCRAYAEKYVKIQRDNFARFGVLAEWSRPYLTMAPDYEAGILDVWATLVEKGYVTRGLRSIHWCVTCKTALAEAELEYGPETSASIHVRFAVAPESLARVGGVPASVVIWTTTPWTLPANVAVAVHPKLQYAVVEHDGPDRVQRAIVALPLVEKYLAAVKGTDHTIPLVVSGADLKGVVLRHPFLDRASPVVLADYVSAEDGTGAVHTAPGHGADDFATGKREGLPILNPVGPDGVYMADVGVASLTGVHVFKADAPVLALLREHGALAAEAKLEHSYPHCWRCKRPVIFRATDQWFIAVDHEGLRKRALDACESQVQWFPAWGKQRRMGMLRERPDWCVSRQRVWGVPIPALYCEACGKVEFSADFVRHVRDLVAREGADAWFKHETKDVVPAGTKCACGGTSWRRETDIFDVWFESGTSWRSVLDRPGHGFPADLYEESQDQHRGWFQASLLPALAAKGNPPFRHVVTHGFFTDDAGDKVSKSKGGMKDLSADVLANQIGADITRLFFCSGNFFEDIAISRRLIDPAADMYRKVRNTFRFLLGGVSGFDPKTDALPAKEMLAIDRWAVGACDDVVRRVDSAYAEYDFCKVSSLLREFMDNDLSAFYLDLVKDRLYCAAAASREGRSVRTALSHLASALVRAWAPILTFTSEEAWQHLPALRTQPSVHLELMHRPAETDAEDMARIERLRAVRAEIQRKVDPLRKAGAVGATGEVSVRCDILDSGFSWRPTDEEIEVLGVASVHVAGSSGAPPALGVIHEGLSPVDPALLRISVEKTTLLRCERCRRHRPDVKPGPAGADPLCARCEAWRGQEK